MPSTRAKSRGCSRTRDSPKTQRDRRRTWPGWRTRRAPRSTSASSMSGGAGVSEARPSRRPGGTPSRAPRGPRRVETCRPGRGGHHPHPSVAGEPDVAVAGRRSRPRVERPRPPRPWPSSSTVDDRRRGRRRRCSSPRAGRVPGPLAAGLPRPRRRSRRRARASAGSTVRRPAVDRDRIGSSTRSARPVLEGLARPRPGSGRRSSTPATVVPRGHLVAGGDVGRGVAAAEEQDEDQQHQQDDARRLRSRVLPGVTPDILGGSGVARPAPRAEARRSVSDREQQDQPGEPEQRRSRAPSADTT